MLLITRLNDGLLEITGTGVCSRPPGELLVSLGVGGGGDKLEVYSGGSGVFDMDFG